MSGPRLKNQLQPGRCVLSQLLQVFPARIDRARRRHPCGDAGMTIAALGGEGRAAAVDVWKLPN